MASIFVKFYFLKAIDSVFEKCDRQRDRRTDRHVVTVTLYTAECDNGVWLYRVHVRRAGLAVYSRRVVYWQILTSVNGRSAVSTAAITLSAATSAPALTATDSLPISAPAKVST